MSDNNKDTIKVIDINGDNFFSDGESYFKKNAKSSNTDKFLTKLIVTAVVLSLLLIAMVVFAPLDKLNNETSTENKVRSELSKNKRDGFHLFKKRENILFLGLDSNGDDTDPFEGTRTDTIVLISLDKFSKSASVISIPRDSKVYINGHGNDKINAAYGVGGIESTIRTVQNMFGVKVDHYVLINNEGVKEIVKVLGSIPVTVEKK